MDFAFLIHSRDHTDIQRKYKIAKFLPRKLIEFWCSHASPMLVAKVEGMKQKGWIIGVPLTAKQMMDNKEKSRKRIIQAINKAEKLGAKIVGLGALTSSVTYGGEEIKDKVNLRITPGHAYTIFTISSYVLKALKEMEAEVKNITLCIVGAAGSIGSGSAAFLSEKGIKKFILLDLERKRDRLKTLKNKLITKEGSEVFISHDINDLKKADIIIAATNTPETLIKPEHLKRGAIIIDDAQPSDVSPEVLKQRDDVIVIDGGVISSPRTTIKFDFGLAKRENVFSCLAETMIIADTEKLPDYKAGEVPPETVDSLGEFGKKLGFEVSNFQRFKKVYSQEEINKIKKIWTPKVSC